MTCVTYAGHQSVQVDMTVGSSAGEIGQWWASSPQRDYRAHRLNIGRTCVELAVAVVCSVPVVDMTVGGSVGEIGQWWASSPQLDYRAHWLDIGLTCVELAVVVYEILRVDYTR